MGNGGSSGGARGVRLPFSYRCGGLFLHGRSSNGRAEWRAAVPGDALPRCGRRSGEGNGREAVLLGRRGFFRTSSTIDGITVRKQGYTGRFGETRKHAPEQHKICKLGQIHLLSRRFSWVS